MFFKSLLCLFVLGTTLAQEYSDDQTAREQQLAPNYARQPYNTGAYDHVPSEPYDFGFQSTDEFGTIMNRQESSDSNGAVRGSYGYTDPYGVFRHVDYVADEYGFRAEVKSNEPGMGTQSPANVVIYAEPPPAGVIVERPYYQPGQLGQSGQAGAGQQPSRRNPASAASNTANRQVRPAARVPVATTRTTVYPYNPNQQNAYGSNAVGSSQYPQAVGSPYSQSAGNQYPQAVGSPYSQSAGNQYSQTAGNQYAQSAGSQYPQTVSSQYAANAAANSASNSQYGSGYQASASAYPGRNSYLSSQGYSGQASSHSRATAGSASSSSSQQPIVAKPYDGPTYKIGNPHVTDLVRAEKEESGSILLPTVVTTGGVPTLVKHIHAYPAAPVA